MGGIFKAYDIRGAYPDELDAATAEKIGYFFVRLLGARRIVIGRDMRLSSPSLAEAFIEGAIRAGASVIDIGMVSTPLLYYAIIDGNYDGGAMVTASHLPSRMNGFKLCREQAIPLSGDRGLPLLERMVQREVPAHPSAYSPGSCQKGSILETYIERMSGFVRDTGSFRIVVDAGNGMAGPEVPLLFRKFPSWTLIPLYFEPDGRFPHHVPNPLIPTTTRKLQARVEEERADLGVAFDGDMDRCGFVDEKGTRVREDLVTALVAGYLLSEEPGASILYDLRSSRIVPETIARLGGRAVRSRVGHAFIKARMREENALFAGELSGHYYFRDMGFTDNGLMTMVQMLNLLSREDRPLSALVRPLERYASSGEINLRVSGPDTVLSALEAHYGDAEIDHLDGLTVEYRDWWFNIRPSHTEPLIRLNLEAENRVTMEAKKSEVLDVVREADPAMTLV